MSPPGFLHKAKHENVVSVHNTVAAPYQHVEEKAATQQQQTCSGLREKISGTDLQQVALRRRAKHRYGSSRTRTSA